MRAVVRILLLAGREIPYPTSPPRSPPQAGREKRGGDGWGGVLRGFTTAYEVTYYLSYGYHLLPIVIHITLLRRYLSPYPHLRSKYRGLGRADPTPPRAGKKKLPHPLSPPLL